MSDIAALNHTLTSPFEGPKHTSVFASILHRKSIQNLRGKLELQNDGGSTEQAKRLRQA